MAKRRRITLTLFVGLCLVAVTMSWAGFQGSRPAALQVAAGSSSPAGQTDMPGLALRVGLSLLLILVLVLGAAYIMRLVRGRTGGHRPGSVRVLDRCYLAPRRALYTVAVGRRVLLVGVTENSITPVVELSEEESRRMQDEVRLPLEEAASFSGVLRSISSRLARQRS